MDTITRLSSVEKKKQSLLAGLLINEVLKIHGKSEQTEPFEMNPYGKRIYSGFDINISHSHNMISCAWSDSSVGIDIEKLRTYDKRIPIRFFSKDEQTWILNSKDPIKSFFRLWTRKESLAKWRGTGIQKEFFDEILLPDDSPLQEALVENQKLYYHTFEIEAFVLSVCTTDAMIIQIPKQIFFDL